MIAAVFALIALSRAEDPLKTGGSNCDYVSDKVHFVDVDNITGKMDQSVYIGKSPLPEKIQGAFWLVDDGGDALVAFGSPPGGGNGECNNGNLTKEADRESYCATVSTVRPGGWTFQALATPGGLFGGKFPSPADSFYRTCGTKWKFCFDSNGDPSTFDAKAISTRGLPCVNVFALASTTGEYKGSKYGGHYWRVTTKALGIVPMPSWLPGNFDMIQVMDAQGNRIQPAWDNFASKNKQIVYYHDEQVASSAGFEDRILV